MIPIAVFSNISLKTSSGKHLEDNNNAHIVFLLYNRITSAKESDNLSIGFDRYRGRRRDELTEIRNIKGKFHVRFILKDVFGFAEIQEEATYGLADKLTLTRNKDETILDKAAGIADARFIIDHIHC